jgi:hypothetical protein
VPKCLAWYSISVTSDKYSTEAQNLEQPESTTTKTLWETPLHHVHSISLALLKLIIHKIDLESVRFPHVAQKLDVPLVVLRTSLYKPRCLASIHTSLISWSYDSNASGSQHFVATKLLVCILRPKT